MEAVAYCRNLVKYNLSTTCTQVVFEVIVIRTLVLITITLIFLH